MRRRFTPTLSFAPAHLHPGADVLPLAGVSLLIMVLAAALSPLRTYVLTPSLPPVEVKAIQGPLPAGQVVLRADASGLSLNGVPTADARLRAETQYLLTGQKDPVVFIDAAADLPYERVVFLIEQARLAGAQTVGLTPDLTPYLQPPATPAPQAAPTTEVLR